jgi:hypothetical protein
MVVGYDRSRVIFPGGSPELAPNSLYAVVSGSLCGPRIVVQEHDRYKSEARVFLTTIQVAKLGDECRADDTLHPRIGGRAPALACESIASRGW